MNIGKPYKKIVCASNFEEWLKLSFSLNDTVIPAYGIHPWFVAGSDIGELEKFIKDNDCLIGECGLDRLRPYESQEEVFIAQLDLAKKYNKAVVIHCVRAWDVMIDNLKGYQDLKFLFHRFTGNEQIIAQLPENSYFSLGLNNLEKYLNIVPKDRVLLESDDEDIDISVLYEKSGLSAEQVYENAKQLLGDLIL